MRSVIPLTIVAAAAGCTAAPPPPMAAPSLEAQSELAQALSGKVAGTPQSCLPNWRTHGINVIDDNTIVFRDSPGRVWLQRPQNACNLLSAGPYALVTRDSTGMLCQGDIGQVVETLSGTTVGSCVMGPFVPYTRSGA